MRPFRFLLGMTAAAAFVTLALAQTTGGLRIIVVDKTDQTPLPGATVVIRSDKQLVAETAVRTDINGIAEFPVLRAGGGYSVQISMDGYSPVRQSDIRVKIGETQTFPLALTPAGELVEEVKVTAERPVVDLESTRQSTSFGEEFIQDLPVQGRFYTNILTLAPGVQDDDGDGNPNVHGGRERDFATVVGGVSNVDPLTGLRLSNINIDSIEEIEVITAGVGVEHGRATAGLANIIEKQGTNNFEGVASFTYSSSKLDGNGATNLTGSRVPDFDRLQPALVVSGPILRDKLWYFFANELIDREDPVNTLSEVAVQENKQITSTNKLTWQASRRNKLELTSLFNQNETGNVGVSSTLPPESTSTQEFTAPTTRLTWTAPYSPKLLVETRVAFTDAGLDISPSVAGGTNECVSGLEAFEGSQCQNLQTGQVSGPWPITYEDERQRLTVATDADVYVGQFWGANHQLTLGFSVENERFLRRQSRRPFILFFPLTSISEEEDPTGGGSGTPEIEPQAFVTANLDVPAFNEARATSTNWAMYIKDQIKPMSNLTVTLGARVAHQLINANGFSPFDPTAEAANFLEAKLAGDPDAIRCRDTVSDCPFFTVSEGTSDFVVSLANQLGVPTDDVATRFTTDAFRVGNWETFRGLENIDLAETVISPEIAVAWDPFKTGKTQIAATYGRSYGNTFLAIPLLELTSINTDVNFIATREAGEEFVVEDVCGGDACLNPTANGDLVDRNLELPYTDEWTVTFERQLAAETSLKVSWVKRRNENQFQDIDINHDVFDLGRCECASGTCRVEDSPGISDPNDTSTWLVDQFTGELYLDTDPGDGDGRLDDCIGNITSFEQDPDEEDPPIDINQISSRQTPDGFLDSYLLNPAWGELFLVGNFNSSFYRGLTVELNRRQYRNWQMNASYTWSKAIGDAEDFNQQLGDDRAIAEDERGFLDFDRRHSLKVNATTIVPWWGGFRFGGSVRWQSGLPYSIELFRTRFDAIIPEYEVGAPEARGRRQYPTGQRNDQRNESWWTIDLRAVKELNLRGGMNLQITGEIFNLLNENHLRVFSNFNSFNASVREFGRRFQVGFRLAF